MQKRILIGGGISLWGLFVILAWLILSLSNNFEISLSMPVEVIYLILFLSVISLLAEVGVILYPVKQDSKLFTFCRYIYTSFTFGANINLIAIMLWLIWSNEGSIIIGFNKYHEGFLWPLLLILGIFSSFYYIYKKASSEK